MFYFYECDVRELHRNLIYVISTAFNSPLLDLGLCFERRFWHIVQRRRLCRVCFKSSSSLK